MQDARSVRHSLKIIDTATLEFPVLHMMEESGEWPMPVNLENAAQAITDCQADRLCLSALARNHTRFVESLSETGDAFRRCIRLSGGG